MRKSPRFGVYFGSSLRPRATRFICTSSETANTIRIGVQLFAQSGGSPQNDVSVGDGALDVAPGQTVTFVTNPLSGLGYDAIITGGGSIHNGSARIIGTSTKIVCTAFLLDKVSSPPASMTYLTIVAKTKQKAAN